MKKRRSSTSHKVAYPLARIRRYLEPGPIVLVSSSYRGERNIMTMGWHMMLGFRPALIGCYIWEGNHSFDLIRRSGECVINLPTAEQIDAVVGVGNCSGRSIDKFERFGFTPIEANIVEAPLIGEAHANFECTLEDASQVRKRGLFIWRVVKAHVARPASAPKTLHYRGNGEFMISGSATSRRASFKRQNL